jgi:hypothetical protein
MNKHYIRVEEERNITSTRKRSKDKWIGKILHRNCHLQHVIEGKKGLEDEEEDISS